jgi:hypothetical protein
LKALSSPPGTFGPQGRGAGEACLLFAIVRRCAAIAPRTSKPHATTRRPYSTNTDTRALRPRASIAARVSGTGSDFPAAAGMSVVVMAKCCLVVTAAEVFVRQMRASGEVAQPY